MVESGRSIMAAPRLSRAEQVTRGPEDFKFTLGDLLANGDDLDDERLNELAEQIGFNLTGQNLKSYREVARAWPPEQRVAASWTVHRTLKKMPDRFERIEPSMTLREAQVVTGKTPADTEHPSRWDSQRRVEFLITQLQDPLQPRLCVSRSRLVNMRVPFAQPLEQSRKSAVRSTARPSASFERLEMRSIRSGRFSTRFSNCGTRASTCAPSVRRAVTSIHSCQIIGRPRWLLPYVTWLWVRSRRS